MALTNSQHDAIMRTYDAIRTENQHIQNERYAQVTAACPEIAQIEDDIIGLSMQAAAEMLKNPDYKTAYRKKLSELADRKAACLAALGRPADYLEPVYTCPKCKDTGYIGQHKCACFTKKAIELVYHDSNLKNIITTENFDTFSYEWYDKKTPIPSIGLTPYNNMQNIVSICHRFVDVIV
jgi:DNA replication protein DnaC